MARCQKKLNFTFEHFYPTKLIEMTRFEQLNKLIDSLESDFQKFYESGNKAAGTRVRNGMNEAKKLAQEIRTEVTEIKNSDK